MKIHKRTLGERQTAVRTKIVALIYGFVFVGLAFTAQFLGGVLQAALTIFGVVGGPLLGLFSLGMFTLMANQKVRTYIRIGSFALGQLRWRRYSTSICESLYLLFFWSDTKKYTIYDNTTFLARLKMVTFEDK